MDRLGRCRTGEPNPSLDPLPGSRNAQVVEHGHDRQILTLRDAGEEQCGVGQIDNGARLLFIASKPDHVELGNLIKFEKKADRGQLMERTERAALADRSQDGQG